MSMGTREVPAARFLTLLAVSLLVGCETLLASKYDVNSQFYKIPAGSKLILHQPLNIPAGKAHVVIQPGTSGASTSVDGSMVEMEHLNNLLQVNKY